MEFLHLALLAAALGAGPWLQVVPAMEACVILERAGGCRRNAAGALAGALRAAADIQVVAPRRPAGLQLAAGLVECWLRGLSTWPFDRGSILYPRKRACTCKWRVPVCV